MTMRKTTTPPRRTASTAYPLGAHVVAGTRLLIIETDSATPLTDAGTAGHARVDRAALKPVIAGTASARGAGTAETCAARGRPASGHVAGAATGIGIGSTAISGNRDVGRVGHVAAIDPYTTPGIADADSVAGVAPAVNIADGDRATLGIRVGDAPVARTCRTGGATNPTDAGCRPTAGGIGATAIALVG